MKRGRRPDPRRIKIHRAYSIEELARTLDCHKNTVRLWLKQGLTALADRQRPLLIHGSTARAFLEARRRASKRKCQPNELFCFTCKEPRSPAVGTAAYQPITNKSGMLRGPCPCCSTPMFKFVSAAEFSAPQAPSDGPAQESARTLKKAA